MKITVVLKGSVNALPPILSLCKTLLDLKYEITLICDGISEEEKKILQERGTKIIILGQAVKLPTKFGTVVRWLTFRKNAWNAIRQNPADLYWIGSADTALALGNDLLYLRYVLHVHELYDTVPRYREGLKSFMRNAKKVFVPEEVRAHIFRAWYQLKETPVVLPNRPYEHPRTRNMPITDPTAAEAFARIPKDATILFYQGGVNKSRNIRPFLEAVISLGHPWCLAIQCPECDYDYVRENYHCNNVYYIPYIPAPRHLEITSRAHVGLVTYEHLHMNNEFCAPNKIWEYAGFGLPIIGNDVYGLSFPIQKYNFGVTVNPDIDSCSEIKQKLLCITNNEEQYSMNAKKFFDSFNLEENIKRVLDALCIEGKNR